MFCIHIQAHSDTHKCAQFDSHNHVHEYIQHPCIRIDTYIQAHTEHAHSHTSTQAAVDVRHQEGAHLLHSIEQSRFHLHGAENNLDYVLQVNKTLKVQREDAVRRAADLDKRVSDSKMDVDALRERRDGLAARALANVRTKVKLCVR